MAHMLRLISEACHQVAQERTTLGGLGRDFCTLSRLLDLDPTPQTLRGKQTPKFGVWG